jgi:hypothetical protein
MFVLDTRTTNGLICPREPWTPCPLAIDFIDSHCWRCIAPSISYDANNVYLTIDDC